MRAVRPSAWRRLPRRTPQSSAWRSGLQSTQYAPATSSSDDAAVVDGWGSLWAGSVTAAGPEEEYIGTGVARLLEEEARAGRALPWTRLETTAGSGAASGKAKPGGGRPQRRRQTLAGGGERGSGSSLPQRPTSVADDLIGRRPLYAQPINRRCVPSLCTCMSRVVLPSLSRRPAS